MSRVSTSTFTFGSSTPWITAVLLAGWFIATVLLSAGGVFASPPGDLPLALGAAIVLPIAIYGIGARHLGGGVFHGLFALPLPALVGLQVWRVGGIFFLVEWWLGHLPAGFALPAAVGDLLVGFTAPLLAGRLSGPGATSRRRFIAWHFLGIADLAIAVTAGITHARSPLGVFAGPVPSDLVATYPLALVPTFLVPLAVILHLTALARAHEVPAGAAEGGSPCPPPRKARAEVAGLP